MARPKAAAPQLNPGQASYVLDRMIADRRISARDVERYESDMQREIADLEDRLQNLRQASANGGDTPQRARSARPGAKRRRRVSAEQLPSRKIQGRYLGLIRQVPASPRGHFQKIAKDRGREAAIKELVSALGK